MPNSKGQRAYDHGAANIGFFHHPEQKAPEDQFFNEADVQHRQNVKYDTADGIVDVKAYTFDGDMCVAAERVYTFPSQMSALRHYRNAIEKAELYDNIELFNNQVRYKLKEAQCKVESKGMNKEQMKAKFEKQIADAKADLDRKHHKK